MERWQKITIASLAVLIVGFGSFSFGYSMAGGRANPILFGDSEEGRSGLALVQDTFDRIKAQSLDPPGDDVLARGAIKGMIEALKRSGDDYALFYSPSAYESFQELTTGEFSGIGVWLKDRRNQLEIVSVLPSTPALEAGLKRGDVIETIDDDEVDDLSTDQAIDSIKGKPGTDVRLGILRDGQRLSFTVTRATIELPNEMSKMVAEDLGYIRLFGFANGAGEQVRDDVGELQDQGARGIILDLRDNGGGLFSEGVNVASVFIESGEVVTYKQRSEGEVVYEAEGNAFEDVPLVVLVNEGTASASEIVTGALKDRDRAIIVGVTTYGKGVVQEVQPLSDSSAFKLTIGAYFTPGGMRIDGKGIKPHVVVDAGPKQQRERAVQILEGIVLSDNGAQD